MKIFVGCSASEKISEHYVTDCKKLLEKLFDQHHDLVFGASNSGLMGVAYQIAQNKGRKITAICPKAYQSDLKQIRCTKAICTDTISDRTTQLLLQSDVILFLPGGIGTLYELMTCLESKRNHEFDKPIYIYNSCGFYDSFLSLLNNMKEESLITLSDLSQFQVFNDAESLLRVFE